MINLTLLLPIKKSSIADLPYEYLPSLSALFCAAKFEAKLPQNFINFLSYFLNCKPSQLSVASLSAHGDGLALQEEECLRLDPIKLVADMNQVLVSNCSEEPQTDEKQYRELIAQIDHIMLEEGVKFFTPQPRRWYVSYKNKPQLQTVSIYEALAKPLQLELGANNYWLKIFTELQMLCHQHCTQAQLSQVNGVWLWGANTMDIYQTKWQWQQVFSDEPISRGLCLEAGINYQSASNLNFHEIFNNLKEGNNLIILSPPLFHANEQEKLNFIEQNWLQPINKALSQKQLRSVSYYFLDGYVTKHKPSWWQKLFLSLS